MPNIPLSYDDYQSVYTRDINKSSRLFRYGLFNSYPNENTRWNSEYEDPLIAGFTLELDTEESSLFKEMGGFLDKYGNNYPELKARKNIYNLFTQDILQFFNTLESGSTGYKGHYISSISGFEKLNKKFIENDESYIEISMNEDCRMFAQNLAYLYNNLIYSYKDLKRLIPYNLEYFNLYIKISEIRNYHSLRAEIVPGDKYMNLNSDKFLSSLKKNISCIIYKLWNCSFDFSESGITEDEIRIGGFGGGDLPDPSTMKFRINFKTVSRIFNPSLIYENLILDDNEWNLAYKLHQSITVPHMNGNTSTVNGLPLFKEQGYTNIQPMEILTQQPMSEENKRIIDDYRKKQKDFNDTYIPDNTNGQTRIII